jgi:hypothetical protein
VGVVWTKGGDGFDPKHGQFWISIKMNLGVICTMGRNVESIEEFRKLGVIT